MKRKLKSAVLHNSLDNLPGLNVLKTTLNEGTHPGIELWLEDGLVGVKLKTIIAYIPITNFKFLIEAENEKVLEAGDRFTNKGSTGPKSA